MGDQRPGDMFTHPDYIGVILAVTEEKVLIVCPDDGLSRVWLSRAFLARTRPIDDPVAYCREQMRRADALATEAVFSSGATSALRNAKRAGTWEALADIVGALRTRP